MVNNRKDSCRMESCGGDVCACGSEVYAVCWWLLEHWNTGTTGTLEQLEQPGQQKGGCELCREDVWWLWTV